MYPFSTAVRGKASNSATLPTLTNQPQQYFAPSSYLRSMRPASDAFVQQRVANLPRPQPMSAGGMDVVAPFTNMFRGLVDRANQTTQNAANVINQQGLTQAPQTPTGAAKPKTNRDMMHEGINGKLGEGWVERFTQAHGMSPLDFYANPQNWFPYQETAAQDYGTDSPQFWNATQRAAVEEGMKHAQEAAMWQQLHGNTPIPQEMWENWYYINRYGNSDNRPVVW